MDLKTRTAAEVLVDQLIIHGVTDVFCVPGESYLPALDAMIDRDIRLTVCRQEGGAAIMAEAVGKQTGRPGVCFVTRGPGATNAAHGVHIAQQSSSPMIMFVGQVDRGVRGRDAWQELDYPAVFGSMTKWAAEIDDPARVPEMVARAFQTAMNGRPGPVVLALPEDMLRERVTVADAPLVRLKPPMWVSVPLAGSSVTTAAAPLALMIGSSVPGSAIIDVAPVTASVCVAAFQAATLSGASQVGRCW